MPFCVCRQLIISLRGSHSFAEQPLRSTSSRDLFCECKRMPKLTGDLILKEIYQKNR